MYTSACTVLGLESVGTEHMLVQILRFLASTALVLNERATTRAHTGAEETLYRTVLHAQEIFQFVFSFYHSIRVAM